MLWERDPPLEIFQKCHVVIRRKNPSSSVSRKLIISFAYFQIVKQAVCTDRLLDSAVNNHGKSVTKVLRIST